MLMTIPVDAQNHACGEWVGEAQYSQGFIHPCPSSASPPKGVVRALVTRSARSKFLASPPSNLDRKPAMCHVQI